MKDFEEFLKQVNISDHSKTTLLFLMKKKEKENKMQRNLNIIGVTTIITILLFASYFYYKMKINGGLGTSALNFILNDSLLLFLMATLAFLLYSMFYFKKKFDKAEKDVDKIRDDILDRSMDYWKTKDELKERYKVFKYLKDKQDINLFHK
ncbi:DUF2663 family protein [Anaerobacillus alkaliphilus]|uniref:DUF2663 family protein n=1 Tax=Anaerobacillus alkaliphilus TaxID=1548597 RepID=A0A4Q0VXK9_9BACI|nr:DUF2663 family protein [Anaerobacillus alkaliphilus]RXJ03906.1 DUF2663 family protein [Anaerobacillus alkaliphilus]